MTLMTAPYYAQPCSHDEDEQLSGLYGALGSLHDSESSRYGRKVAETNAATIVSLANADHECYTSVLRKTSLYSDPVILTLDVDLEFEQDRPTAASHSDTVQVLKLNSLFRDLVEPGLAAFLPRRLFDDYDGGCDNQLDYTTYSVPLLQHGSEPRYLTVDAQPIIPGTRDYMIYKNLFLPYFPEASLVDVARIAQDERDSFVKFNLMLKRRLAEVAKADSTTTVAAVMDEIMEGVATLNLEAEKIGKRWPGPGMTASTFAVSLAALVANNPVVTGAAGVLGSLSLLEVLKEFRQRDTEKAALKASPYYVPYVIRSWMDD